MKKNIYFMYTGQGSQYFGMCKKYYKTDEVFHYWMDTLNDFALNVMGHSVLKYLYDEDKHNSCNICDDITYTHVAICMIEYAMTKSLMDKGVVPDVIIGSSLGEYVCMAVAGMLTIQDLLTLLIDQSYLLKRVCNEGKMAAVVDDYEKIKDKLQDIEIASVDYDKHFVMSGDKEKIEHMTLLLKNEDIGVFDIPVRYGFHSHNIDCIKEEYMNILEKYITFSKANISILSSSKAKMVKYYDKEDLWNIVRRPILFKKIILEYCFEPDIMLIDVGPSSTLAGFCKNILNTKENIYGICSPFNIEKTNIDKILKDYKKTF